VTAGTCLRSIPYAALPSRHVLVRRRPGDHRFRAALACAQYGSIMGDAAAADIDTTGMMQRLEALQREREQLDARVEELAREDDRLVERGRACVEEREALELRRIALDTETVELEARRETLEDEQQALVSTRDALDRQYTELYALLDRAADDLEAPVVAAPITADRLTEVGPASVPMARPAPWRTTLVIVPDEPGQGGTIPAMSPPAVAPAQAKPWLTTRVVIAIAASLIAVVTMGAIAAWPETPPPTPEVDPKAGLELFRAAIVPATEEPPAPAAAAPAEPTVTPPAPAPKRRTEKRRTSSKRKSTATKPKKKQGT